MVNAVNFYDIEPPNTGTLTHVRESLNSTLAPTRSRAMPAVTIALRSELESLEAELAADPRYRKAQKIRELLAMYAEQPLTEIPSSPTPQPTKAENIRSAIAEIMRTNGGMVHRQEILDHLIGLKIMGHESNPMGSLAAYLSEMKDMFVSHGGGKWGLRREPIPASQKVRGAKPDSMTTAINRATAIYLREKGARAQAPEILKALLTGGLNVSKGTMSSCLSHSPLFDNKRGEGYGLTEWSRGQETETPNSGTLFGAPKGNGSSPLSP